MEVLSLKERTAEDLTEQLPCGREEMIEKNIGLVHACVHRFQGRGIEYEDLFQAGCMGLIKATDASSQSIAISSSVQPAFCHAFTKGQ